MTASGSTTSLAPARGSFSLRRDGPPPGVDDGGTTIGRIAMARPDKAAAVAELTDLFRESNAAVLTEYRGLTVAQLKQLRRSLSGNATYAVVKNTLTAIAAKEAGVQLDDADLAGPSAIAFVTGDPVEAAKGLRDFAKANPQLVIKAGVLDGRPLTAEEINKLADLESREVLLAKAAGAFKASLFGAAYLFTAPASKAVRTIDALREKQASQESAA
ncbi:LSU ribosomal protein L10P [Flavimobilis marinus]|uniref:Large ribosomal subunit protein uL10 n=2 Tax=Flavimobilis marinus TaxID=285351 RepID=A0A1I2D3N3_9MICO|nr:LSU ribosomal protein L10P [Flavimobilis marinus]